MADPIYTSASPIAVNPANGELIGGATFTVHAPDDTSFSTPLAVTDPNTGVAINPLRSNSNGTLPSFKVAGDLPRVKLKSGGFVTELISLGGLVAEQVSNAGLDPETVTAAIAAADTAATKAGEAADSATAAAATLGEVALKASAVAEVVATNDGIMKNVMEQPESEFGHALSIVVAQGVADGIDAFPQRSLAVGSGLTLSDDGSTVVIDTASAAPVPRASLNTFDPAQLGTAPGSVQLLTGVLRLSYFRAPVGQSFSRAGFRLVTHAFTGSGAPTTARVGLYKVLANGAHTLVAATANDPTLFGAVGADDNKLVSRALTAPYLAEASGLYALACLFVGPSNGPLVGAQAMHSDYGFRWVGGTLAAEPIASYMNGQADLPASIAAGAVSSSGARIWGEIA